MPSFWAICYELDRRANRARLCLHGGCCWCYHYQRCSILSYSSYFVFLLGCFCTVCPKYVLLFIVIFILFIYLLLFIYSFINISCFCTVCPKYAFLFTAMLIFFLSFSFLFFYWLFLHCFGYSFTPSLFQSQSLLIVLPAERQRIVYFMFIFTPTIGLTLFFGDSFPSHLKNKMNE